MRLIKKTSRSTNNTSRLGHVVVDQICLLYISELSKWQVATRIGTHHPTGSSDDNDATLVLLKSTYIHAHTQTHAC